MFRLADIMKGCKDMWLSYLQASWLVMQDAVNKFPGVGDAELEDIGTMVKLCPDVVYLQDTSRYTLIS